jgi:mRNA interferase RelE/StbE
VPYIGFAFTDPSLDFLGTLPPKIRRQVIKKAKALHTSPHPPTSKKLHDVETPDGDPVYRERSGDYRILYVVRSNQAEVLILDIDNRKDVYRMPKTNPKPADDMRMKEADFNEMMKGALGAQPPEKEGEPPAKRLAANPKRKRA